MHRSILMLSLFLFLCSHARAAEFHFDHTPRENDPHSLVIPRAVEAPVIDGDLSDKAWQRAAVIKAFWLGGSNRTAENQTLAWITFDADNLYVAYAAQDKIVQTGRYPHDDRQVWMHDAVELHLSPTRDPGKIYQFIVGASGSTYDRSTVDRTGQEQVAWNPPVAWQSAVQLQPFGYTVEICIPFAAVLDRAKYDVDRGSWWRIKLTRLDFGGQKECDLSSWTRMGTNTSDQFSLGDIFFESRNLLDNGSAEAVDAKGAPLGWETPHHGMTLTATTTEDGATDGARIARFELRGEPKGGINSRIYPGKVARHRAPVDTTYRFSADVRAECESGGLISYFVVFNGSENSKVMYKLNAGWQHVEAMVTVEAGKTTAVPAVQSVPSNHLKKAQVPGGVIDLDNVKFEPIEPADLTGDPDTVCLTGNAFGAQRTRNAPVDGAYTYRETGTVGSQFPNYLRGEKPPEVLEYAGWIPFQKGLLTDGLTATGVQWANFWVGAQGNDIEFDLKQDFIITRVVVMGRDVGKSQVFTKAVGDPRFALTASTQTLFDWDTGKPFKGSDTECVMNVPSQPARWVRVQIRSRDGSNPCEVQIWGKPSDGGTVARKPLLQNEGQSPIASPQSRPIVYRDIPPIFPTPQEIAMQGPALPLRDGLTIAWASAGGERARITAEVLAEELKTCFGVTARVVEGSNGDITLGEGDAAPGKPDGYLLVNDGQRIAITGHDPRGTFYGVQALLSLVRRSSGEGWEVLGTTVRDWPDMPVRYIQGRPMPDKGLIRALARFRITHYETQARFLAQAAQWDKEANRYFVQLVPELAFNRIVLSAAPTLVERGPDEAIESMGNARRNANPGDPRSWEIYLAEVEKWLPRFHGNLVHINYDETYQESGGARWNVSPESRALGLSAGDLIAYQINRINDVFKKHGKTIVMHDTAFMGHHTLSYAGDPNPNWLAAIPKLPRDVRFLIWHPDDAELILHQAGFELYWLVLDEVDWRKLELPGRYAGLTAYMAESAFTPAKLINMVGATWNLKAPRSRDPQANNVTASYVPVWRELHAGDAKPSRYATAQDYTPIDISMAANRSRLDEVAYDGKGFVDMGANVDLRALASGVQTFANVPFHIIDESAGGASIVMIHNDGDADKVLPSEVTIDVKDFKASSLVFLHCLEHRPGYNYLRRKELAGFYVVEYDDGTYARCEIKYAVNTANWSGRPTNSGYNPRGHVMTDGFLAWEGDTTSGMPAFLYATEWVNPCPQKTIVRIRVRGNDRYGHMNPMLFAITALSPRLVNGGGAAPEMPSLHRLSPPRTIGTSYDLSGGVDQSETLYMAPDGTAISVPTNYNQNADHIRWDILDYRSKVGMIHEPGSFAMVRSPVVEYAFAKPTRITGALVTGGYRLERKTEDFEPAIQNLELLVSTDGGKTWVSQAIAKGVSPEEHGPQWLAVTTDQPITNLRVASEAVSGYTNGIERVQLYRP